MFKNKILIVDEKVQKNYQNKMMIKLIKQEKLLLNKIKKFKKKYKKIQKVTKEKLQ